MPQSFADELKSIPMSPSLGESLERAHRFAREQSHRTVTLEHLLLALTEDSEANIIMQSANVDLGKLGADVSGYLGRLDDLRAQGAVEPRPDPELLRVLQAAGQAAQQSKRRQIDGAIVLAAMVGDGKSPAAGLLKALGMTFEEAIRALQRANTQARLKTVTKPESTAPPPAKSAQVATAAPASAAEPPKAAADPATPSDADLKVTNAQTAEDILAAARLRIQQRAAAARGEAARAAEKPAPPPAEPEDLSDATPPAATAAPPIAELPPQTRTPRPAWTPEPDVPPTGPSRGPQTLAGRLPPGFPGAPIAPEDGPARPPLPQSGQPQPPARPAPQRHPLVAAAARAAARQPAPPLAAPVPWADPAERRAPPPRPGAPNGSFPGMPYSGEHHPPPHAPQPPQRGASAPRPAAPGERGERGPLMENVPRRMRLGVSSTAEVRIARDRIDGLILALSGRAMAHRGDGFLARALTVRLRAPNGGFYIEAATPETQWIEAGSSMMHDDFAIWRWTLTPQRRGRGRITLLVSARTVGHDGLAAETAPPDRTIEVKVSSNYSRTLARWSLWLLAALIGAAAGRYASQIWEAGSFVIRAATG